MKIIQIIIFVFLSLSVLAQEFTNQTSNLGINGAFGSGSPIGSGGLSFADFNGDGLDDLTFGTKSGSPIVFYENTGDGFSKVLPPFVDNNYDHRQLVWVDFDNDGDRDFYVVALDGPNKLYENDGTMNFSDVSSSKGLSSINVYSEGGNFSDIDQDGFLDLYVCNYDEEGITLDGFQNEMYRWNPQANSYEDITLSSGTGNGNRTSFASVFFDIDMDNDLDLYVINDYVAYENSLYMNIGSNQFVDISVPSGSNVANFSMNAGIFDYDKDGDFDIYITDIYEAVLLRNNGDNTFENVAISAGVAADEWSWTANLFDYNNDKFDDIYINSQIDNKPNFFYVNNKNGTFSEPLAGSGGITGNDNFKSVSNAIGDINNDGNLDIAVLGLDDNEFRLYVNHEENSNNFIKLNLKGVSSNIEGIGALVEVWLDGVKSIYHKHNTVAFHCQNSDYLHVGIGTASSVDSVIVKWPFPNSEDVILSDDILVNGMNEIEEGVGVVDSYSLELCSINRNIVIDPVPSQIYGAELNLNCSTKVNAGSDVIFQSETSEITLGIGFEVATGAIFQAEIEVCGN